MIHMIKNNKKIRIYYLSQATSYIISEKEHNGK